MLKTFIAVIAPALLLAGCLSAPQPLPEALKYRSPEPTSATATITGSQQVTKSKILADRTASIYTIDGKRNINLYQQKSSSWEDGLWNIPLVVTSGEHTLGVIYTMGGFITRPVDLAFEAKPGVDYEVQFSTDIGVGWNSANSYADFWVADKDSQEIVSGVVRGFTPPQAQTTYVPIVINAR